MNEWKEKKDNKRAHNGVRFLWRKKQFEKGSSCCLEDDDDDDDEVYVHPRNVVVSFCFLV